MGGFYRYNIYPTDVSPAWESSRHSLQHFINIFCYSEKLTNLVTPCKLSIMLFKQQKYSQVELLVGISQRCWGFLQNISMNLIIKSTRDVRKVTKMKHFNSKVIKCNLTCQRCSWRKSERSSTKQGQSSSLATQSVEGFPQTHLNFPHICRTFGSHPQKRKNSGSVAIGWRGGDPKGVEEEELPRFALDPLSSYAHHGTSFVTDPGSWNWMTIHL